MKTVTINQEALEQISKLIPELNQDTQSVNVNVEFYSFTDIVWTIGDLLQVVNDTLMNYQEGEKEVISTSINLVRLAKNLLSIQNAEFLDLLVGEIKYKNENQLKEIEQK
jgi:hypothetical protein